MRIGRRIFYLSLIISISLAAGCKKDGDTIVITTGPGTTGTLAVSSIPAQTATTGTPFNLDLTSYVTGDFDYATELDFTVISGGGYFSGPTYSNTFDTSGLIAVEFLVEDLDSNLALGSFDVDVLAPPAADFTASATYGPAPLSVTFTDQSSGQITSWSWSFGDTGTSALQSPTHSYSAPGIYTVTLTISGPYGSHTMTKYAYINVLTATSNTWYVDSANVSATGNGTTWAQAFQTIWSGIDAATDTDMVLVADGTYTGTSNRQLDFDGKLIYLKAYDLYGSGTCTIDAENSTYIFTFSNSETSDAVLDGFTLTNGLEIGGAGINCSGASPTITNCTFKNCESEYGPAIYIQSSAQPTICNCTITDNTGNQLGGAFYLDNSAVTVANCTFTNNDATIDGGVIWATASSFTISDSTFTGNTANNGGAIFARAANTTCLLDNCTFQTNEATDSGGAILISNSVILQIQSCTLSENEATYGGGIFATTNSEVYASSSIIQRNVASESGAGICTQASSILQLTSSTLKDNFLDGDHGAGIDISASDAQITDCVVMGNEIIGGSNPTGAGVFASGSILTMTRCKFLDNTIWAINGIAEGGALFSDSTNATLLDCTATGNVAEAYSQAGYGGAFSFYSATAHLAVIDNCLVSGNTARGRETVYGGGVALRNINATVTNTTITDNLAYEFCSYDSGTSYGGGIYSSNTNATVLDCTISENTAEGYTPARYGRVRGGGLYIQSGTWVINRCDISGNHAKAGMDGSLGGGLYLDSPAITIANSTITGNWANIQYGASSNYYGGGAMHITSCAPDIQNCLIAGNKSDLHGGAILCYTGSSLLLSNCTISGNTATDTGGGIYLYSSAADATALNSILWNNSAATGDELFAGSSWTLNFLYSDYSNATGDIAGGGTYVNVVGNINSDPLFVSGYYLSHTAAGQAADSPCIDAGSDTAVNMEMSNRTTRTDGVTDSGTVDMGWHYKP